jgi:hypothetical protein
MRIATNDSPVRYYLDEAAAARLGLRGVEALFTITEFGVSFAWRENAADTWSAPIAMVEVQS